MEKDWKNISMRHAHHRQQPQLVNVCPSPPRNCDPVFMVSYNRHPFTGIQLTVICDCGEFDKPGTEAEGDTSVSQLASAVSICFLSRGGTLIRVPNRIESILVHLSRKIVGRKNIKWFSESSGLPKSHLEVVSHPHAYGDSSASPSL